MQAYHEGFREQVKKWPQKPFEKIGDVIVGDIVASWEHMLSGGSGKGATTGKSGKVAKQVDANRSIPPGAVVADLGAGEGPLTKYLSAHPKLVVSKGSFPAALMPRVLAYDLLDTADGIVRGVDCAQAGGVPLPGRLGGGIRERISRLEQRGSQTALLADRGAVDVVVFCLSLMGTDWVGMILEARRILKNGGQILIAEVSSRFTDPSTEQFTKLVERLGFKLMTKEGEKEDGKKDKENSHFVLLRYAKLTDEEVLAGAGKGKKSRGNENGQVNGASSEASEDSEGEALIQEARELDEKEQNRLRLEGQAVLKPCLYKRR
jgi:ribosomal RNA-processing protein 8